MNIWRKKTAYSISMCKELAKLNDNVFKLRTEVEKSVRLYT